MTLGERHGNNGMSHDDMRVKIRFGLPELHTSRTTILPRYSHLRGHASEIFLGSLYCDVTWEVHVPSARLPQVMCISNNKARVGQVGLK